MLTRLHLPRSAALAAMVLLLVPGARPPAAVSVPDDVRVPGLSAPVEVSTDRWDIPHIRAANLHDLYAGWGYVTGRDRLWQLALSRAEAEGTTHLWLGNGALQDDGGAQLFRLRERAVAIWRRDRRDAALRDALEAYAAGVNAAIAQRFGAGHIRHHDEFDRLGVRMEPWRPEDSVMLLLGLGITLDLALPQIGESRVIAEHGAAWLEQRRRFEMEQVFDTVPPDAGTSALPGAAAPRRAGSRRRVPAHTSARLAPVPPATTLASGTLALAEAAEQAHPARAADGSDGASNEFVVGAARTANGKPILANDPHLHLSAPGPFHVVHVVVPGVVDAIGAEVPGLPAIVSGRNDRCAWGVTALQAPVIDVYADSLSADGSRARGPQGWAPVVSLPFDLHVRVLGLELWIPPFIRERKYTAHGPVLVWDAKRHVALAARWSAMEDGRITLARLVGVERSRDAAEVTARYRSLVTPTINVVAADVDGAALYQSVGLVPRRSFPSTRGVLPCDGRHEWSGFVPADSMPAWRVPPARYAVNANNRPSAACGWGRYDFAHDHAARIAQRLSELPRVTLADAEDVQNDIYSRSGERTTRWLVACVDSLREPLTPRERAALDTLRAWDFASARGRVAPTLNRTWLTLLQERTHTAGLPGLLLAGLQGRAPDAFRTPDGGAPVRPAVAARAALGAALDSLSAKLGPDLATWRWGRAHRARFEHALTTALHEERWEPPPIPVDGDGSTVCVGSSTTPHDFRVTHGPVFRHVVDLAIADSSMGVVTPYNSAARRADLREAWANHAYVPFLRSPARIAAETVERLTLRP